MQEGLNDIQYQVTLSETRDKILQQNKQITQLTTKVFQIQNQSKNKINQFQLKNEKLLKDIKDKSDLCQIYVRKHKEQCEKNDLLEKIIFQVQQQAKSIKNYKEKSIQEELNKKVKQMRQFQDQNGKLKDQIKKLSKNLQQSQKLINSLLNQLPKQKSNKDKTQIKKQDQQMNRQDEQSQEQKIKLQNLLKGKQQQNNKLLTQISRLDKLLQQLKKNISPSSEGQIKQMPVKQPKSNQTLNLQQLYQNQTLKPLINPLRYVQKQAQLMKCQVNQLYYKDSSSEKQLYILNHSNQPVDIQQFLRYDWSKLREINFFNSKFDYKKWRTMVWYAFQFPSLQKIYLHGNSITIVKQGDLEEFQKLQQVYFYSSDSTIGEGSNPLSSKSKQYLCKVNQSSQSKSKIIYQ